MVGMRAALGLITAIALATPAIAAEPTRAAAEQVRDQALADPTAYDFVASLTTEVGQRLAGTPAAARARDWGLAQLRALGFVNVPAEAFPMTAWVPGPESPEGTAPHAPAQAI